MSSDEQAERVVPRSHLFMLRLWLEAIGGGQTEWRGRVQHVSSGEVRYFRDWPALEAFVEGLVRANDSPANGTEKVEQANPRAR